MLKKNTGSKMFKNGKHLVTTAGATLSVIGLSAITVAPNVSADAVVNSTVSTQQTTNQTVAPVSAYDQAKAKEQQKLDAIKTTQNDDIAQKKADNTKALEQKQQDLEKEQTALPAKQAQDLANYDKETATKEAQQKLDTQKAIAAKEAAQSKEKAAAAKQSTTDIANKETELNADPAISAQAQRDAATKKRDDALASAESTKQADTKQVETKEQTDTKAVNAQAEAATAAATKSRDDKIANAEYTNNNAESVANAKQAQANKDAKAKQTQADSASLNTQQQAIADAQKAHDNNATVQANQAQVKASQDDYAAKQKIVNDILANTPYVATPTNNLTDDAVMYDEQNKIHRTENLPTELKQPKYNERQDKGYGKFPLYQAVLDQDTSEKVNGALTDAQQKELADYALTLINSWRKSQNLKPVIWTQGTQDVTVTSSKLRANLNMGFDHTPSDLIRPAATAAGLWSKGENMGVVSKSETLTMNNLRVAILDALTNMIYFDASSANLHRLNFEKAEYMGFAVQPNTNTKYPNYAYYTLFGLFGSNDSRPVESLSPVLTPTFASTYRANVNPSQAQYQAATTSKNKLATDEATLANSVKVNDEAFANQTKAINNTYNDAVKAHETTYNEAVQQSQVTRDYEVNNAQSIHDAAIKLANDSYDANMAQINKDKTDKLNEIATTAENQLQNIKTQYDKAAAQAKSTFDTEYAAAKDETESDRQARHERLLADFKAKEAQKLSDLENRLANELVAFKANEANKLTKLLEQRVNGRNALAASQKATLVNFPAHIEEVMASLKTQLDQEYQSLVATKAKEYQAAEAKSQSYLDSINPEVIALKAKEAAQKANAKAGQQIVLPAKMNTNYQGNNNQNTTQAVALGTANSNFQTTNGTMTRTKQGLPSTGVSSSSIDFLPSLLAAGITAFGLAFGFRKQKYENKH
ncbi:SEC10/PgrA surface exclusion domain-containing protein [Leuconostoc citreum]|uniref:SEC10/PgrA surface exclusion domain-containing protein n=1 Tax=Leuconostoc citreum TaxID=33964 RepID=UPI00200A38D4|nr:SEC10/PgrA surface exclusion domain-containing protein [Leuconostoc citreum]MCK8605697.1 SEC10/PgrA surface exclusion domain-containing protein [Leuconostoc citreum]